MKNLLPALATSAIVSLAITSCGGKDSSSTASTTTTTSAGADTAQIEVVSPKDGTTTGSAVDARLRLTHLPDGQHTLQVTVTGKDPTAPDAQASTTFVVKSGP